MLIFLAKSDDDDDDDVVVVVVGRELADDVSHVYRLGSDGPNTGREGPNA